MANRRNEVSDIATLCKRLPKVDLHLHLDGSLSERFLAERAELEGKPLPAASASIRHYLLSTKVVSPTQQAGGNWPAFDICNEYLQTASALRDATLDLLARHHEEHSVRVVEVRFCAALHTKEGLSEDDAVAAVCGAFACYLEGRRAALRGGVLLCALRSLGAKHAAETMDLAEAWVGKEGSYVVGADLAGDEGAFPLTPELAKPLRAASVPLTLHAGEWSSGDATMAVNAGARRIGHGLTIVQDAELMRRMRELGVSVEVCLTSNISRPEKTGVCELADHPVRQMMENGIKVVGFCCDNTMLSGTYDLRPDPSSEIQRAVEYVGLSWRQVRKALIDGARASFAITDCEEDNEFLRRFKADVDRELADAGVSLD